MNTTGVSAISALNSQQNAPVQEQNSEYGKAIGEPKLSDEAKKYYGELKKKFGNYDFVLVSRDQKENAKAHASQYAGGLKTVVLIDEDKIERMATDPSYRKQYEDILSGAANQLEQMKQSMPGNVKGYGMQVNDNGTVSYFAVLEQMSVAQKERIEKKAAEKKAEHQKEVKKEKREEQEERIQEARSHETGNRWNRRYGKEVPADDRKTVTITASSVEELMQRIEEYNFNERSNQVRTESEMMLGQTIDFRG